MASPQPERRRIVGLSTKMYFSLARQAEFTSAALTSLGAVSPASLSAVDVFVIPDFLNIRSTADSLAAAGASHIWVGAQDCHWDDYGAFTGEVSPAALADSGVRIVEVGHAERRRLFGEDDAVTAKKAAAVARNGMVPLVCIGEKTRGTWPWPSRNAGSRSTPSWPGSRLRMPRWCSRTSPCGRLARRDRRARSMCWPWWRGSGTWRASRGGGDLQEWCMAAVLVRGYTRSSSLAWMVCSWGDSGMILSSLPRRSRRWPRREAEDRDWTDFWVKLGRLLRNYLMEL
ncbi:hypothetical protein V2G26_010247 [Clonostachys chloroleuca]